MNGHNSLSVQLGESPWKSHFRLAFEFTHFPQGPRFGPVDQKRQGNRHTFRVDLKMKGIHCPLNLGCLFHVSPAQHVLITTRMTCLLLGSWIPNLLFPEHGILSQKVMGNLLVKDLGPKLCAFQHNPRNGSQANVKHGHVSLTKSYSSFWFLLSIHLQHCRYSVSHTQKKTEYAWKNELRPTLTSYNIDQAPSKPSNANSK